MRSYRVRTLAEARTWEDRLGEKTLLPVNGRNVHPHELLAEDHSG